MRTRVIGLGSTILTDDGIGICVAREVAARLAARPASPAGGDCADVIDVVESETAGFDLIGMLDGWDRVVVVDAVTLKDLPAGEIVRMDPATLRPSLRLSSVHEIDLPTALELGRRLGRPMPAEVVILGVQAEDPYTLGEELTPPVAAALPLAVEAGGEELDRRNP